MASLLGDLAKFFSLARRLGPQGATAFAALAGTAARPVAATQDIVMTTWPMLTKKPARVRRRKFFRVPGFWYQIAIKRTLDDRAGAAGDQPKASGPICREAITAGASNNTITGPAAAVAFARSKSASGMCPIEYGGKSLRSWRKSLLGSKVGFG